MGTYIFGGMIIVAIIFITRYIYKNRKNCGCDGDCTRCGKNCK
ncbi:MAG: FeoB-associated Cys-rich membrane protein [Oscillospiraceae bacterium]